jgi:hypothetical protein
VGGPKAYMGAQDKDGSGWFATKTGVSRFYCSHFKNFYTSDGLSDKEIIKSFVDAKYHVWRIPI